MFQHLCAPPRKVWISTQAVLLSLCAAASGQNFSMQVADPNPLGIGSFVPVADDMEFDVTGKFKGAVFSGLETQAVYNSNFFLTEDDEESEVSALFEPWVRYISDPEGGASVQFEANYTPIIRCYLDNTDLNDVDQAGNFTLRLNGGKTQVAFFGRYNEVSGTDRLTGDFTTGSIFTGGVRGVRQIAPRTSLNGGFSAAISDYGSGANQGAEVYTAFMGGIWQASPRLGFGPTLRYTMSESDNTGTRDAWALMMDARYQLGDRIWLSASLGPEFSSTSGNTDTEDSNSIGLTGNITARYLIDERWAWVTTLRSATVPSPSETNYLVNDIALTTSLQRKLLRGSMSFGMEYNFSDYEDVGTVATSRSDENNLSLFLTYRRSVFSERVFLDSMLRYSVNDGQTDWEQWLLSAGLNVAF